MKTFPQRQRITLAVFILAIIAVGPRLAAEFVPSLSAFVPPFLLTILVVFTIVDALLLWCPLWLFRTLFPELPVPCSLPLSGRSLRNHRLVVAIGILVSGVLTIRWLQSL